MVNYLAGKSQPSASPQLKQDEVVNFNLRLTPHPISHVTLLDFLRSFKHRSFPLLYPCQLPSHPQAKYSFLSQHLWAQAPAKAGREWGEKNMGENGGGSE